MENILGWSDWFDIERIEKTGEFFIHRNYIDEKKSYKYKDRPCPNRSFSESETKDEPEYINQTIPVAKGVLAFFACHQLNKSSLMHNLIYNMDFVATDFYEDYFAIQINVAYRKNDRLPNPDDKEVIRKRFIKDHFKDEQLKLVESTKYFEEYNHEKDNEVLLHLKEYVNGYLNWLAGNSKYETVNTLERSCKGEEEYKFITAWFISKALIDPVTHKWIDRQNGHKKVLAGYLKDLYIKNYTDKLEDSAIQNIAYNSFGVTIQLSTIQHAKAETKDKIPPFLKE